MTSCEQALRHNKTNWKIWNNYILFSIETLQFYKALRGVRELLRVNHSEDITPTLILRLVDCFNKKYIGNAVHEADPNKTDAQPCSPVDFIRHKTQLYNFFNQLTEKMSNHKFWHLIGRVKASLNEDP